VKDLAEPDHEVPVGVEEALQEQVPPEAILSVAQFTGREAFVKSELGQTAYVGEVVDPFVA